MVPVTGLDLHFLSLGERKLWCCRRRAGGKQGSPGALHSDGFSSAQTQNKREAYASLLFWHILHNLIQCNAKRPSVAFVKQRVPYLL